MEDREEESEMSKIIISIKVDKSDRSEFPFQRDGVVMEDKSIEVSNGVRPISNGWFVLGNKYVRLSLKDVLIGKWIIPNYGAQVLVLDATHPSIARYSAAIQAKNHGIELSRLYVCELYPHRQFSEYDMPAGMFDSTIKFSFADTGPVKERKCVWWRDDASLSKMNNDVKLANERGTKFTHSKIRQNQAANPCLTCFVSCATSCDGCCSVPFDMVGNCLSCDECQDNFFFKWHGIKHTVWRSNATTGYVTPSEETCYFSLACCCVPLWPVLPFIGCCLKQ